jgi:NTP pyrophosphatase (non-canonical NTP hydrolase)
MNEKQKEILIITQEECAEVIQEISKIFRFGIENQHKDGMQHQEKLEMEIGDLLCMISLVTSHGLVRPDKVQTASRAKEEKLKVWSKIYD